MIITQEQVRELRQQLQVVLDEFAAANGLRAIVTGGSYTLNNVAYKLELAVVEEDGEAITRGAEHFQFYASSFGLSPQYLGKTFVYEGKTMKVVGLNRRSRSYPIMVDDTDGKHYKFSAESIKKLVVL